MISKHKVFVVIPARGGSRRLKRKNIFPIWGQPMLYWAINACQHSKYIDRVFVSTEDAEIKQIAADNGAEIIDRPAELADHYTFKQDVIVHAMKAIAEKPDLVISLQANSPQICAHDLDAALEKIVEHDRNELFTVNPQLIQNAAFRVMKYDYVFQKSISTRSGVYVTNYVDVHEIEDITFLEANYRPCDHSNRPDDMTQTYSFN
ncbi:MAG: 2-C-methyl-D-erythritol 4-phosphate cytidylyltransferase [Chloroflexota bacterium]